MTGFLNDKSRLAIGIIFLVGGIGMFIFGWIERSNGQEFNQLWILAIVMLFGASVHLQKIGGQKRNQGENEL